MIRKVKFLPKDVYDVILEYAVIPTFDLVIEYGNHGVILVKREIPPYKDVGPCRDCGCLKQKKLMIP